MGHTVLSMSSWKGGLCFVHTCELSVHTQHCPSVVHLVEYHFYNVVGFFFQSTLARLSDEKSGQVVNFP
jgi:hypothetical protein